MATSFQNTGWFFIIIYILNGAEGEIRHYVILRGSMTCGKVQDQRDVARKIRAITNKDAMPGLWLPVREILTISYSWIKEIHQTSTNMARA